MKQMQEKYEINLKFVLRKHSSSTEYIGIKPTAKKIKIA